MIKILTDFTKLNPSEKIMFYYSVITHMTGNKYFKLDASTLEIIKSSTDTFKTLQEKAKNGDRQYVAAMHEQENIVDNLFKSLALTVQQQSTSDSVALSSGFELYKIPVPKEKPDFEAKYTDHSGEALLVKKADDGAKAYEWQQTETPDVESSWVQIDITTKSSITVKGLTPGKLYWFKVRSISAKGKSDFTRSISFRAI